MIKTEGWKRPSGHLVIELNDIEWHNMERRMAFLWPSCRVQFQRWYIISSRIAKI